MADPSQCKALTSVVSSANWAPPNKGKPINSHFESATVCCVWQVKVQVAHKHIPAHTPTCFSTNARHHTLQRETPSPQDPSTCASCAVMAMNIEWAATLAGTHGQRERELKATQKEDTEGRAPILVMRHVGQVEKAKQLPGPPCDNNKALAGSVRWGKMWSSLWCLSTLEAASCCHPIPQPHSNSSTSLRSGLAPANKALQECGSKQTSSKSCATCLDFPQARGGGTSFQMAHQQRRDVWVACMDHRQAICPTGPMSGAPDSCGLPQTKPSQSQRERGGVSHPSVTNRPICPQNFREAIPHSLIMRFCKTCCC